MGTESSNRSDVKNISFSRLHHRGNEGFRYKKSAPQIDLPHCIKILQGKLEKGSGDKAPGIVHKNSRSAEPFLNRRSHFIHSLRIGQIADKNLRRNSGKIPALVGNLFKTRPISRNQSERTSSFRRKPAGNRSADSLTRTGDDNQRISQHSLYFTICRHRKSKIENSGYGEPICVTTELRNALSSIVSAEEDVGIGQFFNRRFSFVQQPQKVPHSRKAKSHLLSAHFEHELWKRQGQVGALGIVIEVFREFVHLLDLVDRILQINRLRKSEFNCVAKRFKDRSEYLISGELDTAQIGNPRPKCVIARKFRMLRQRQSHLEIGRPDGCSGTFARERNFASFIPKSAANFPEQRLRLGSNLLDTGVFNHFCSRWIVIFRNQTSVRKSAQIADTSNTLAKKGCGKRGFHGMKRGEGRRKTLPARTLSLVRPGGDLIRIYNLIAWLPLVAVGRQLLRAFLPRCFAGLMLAISAPTWTSFTLGRRILRRPVLSTAPSALALLTTSLASTLILTVSLTSALASWAIGTLTLSSRAFGRLGRFRLGFGPKKRFNPTDCALKCTLRLRLRRSLLCAFVPLTIRAAPAFLLASLIAITLAAAPSILLAALAARAIVTVSGRLAFASIFAAIFLVASALTALSARPTTTFLITSSLGTLGIGGLFGFRFGLSLHTLIILRLALSGFISSIGLRSASSPPSAAIAGTIWALTRSGGGALMGIGRIGCWFYLLADRLIGSGWRCGIDF